MNDKKIPPLPNQTTYASFAQEKSESTCNSIESALMKISQSAFHENVEYQQQIFEEIEVLLQNVVKMIETRKISDTQVLLSNVYKWTSEGNNSFQIPEPNRTEYRAIASFLSGCIEKLKKNYTSSFSFFMGAATFFEAMHSTTEVAASYIGASQNYYFMGKYPEALTYIKNANELLTSSECKNNAVNPIYETMALLYLQMGKIDESKDFLNRAVKSRHLSDLLFTTEKTEIMKSNVRRCSFNEMIPKPPSADSSRRSSARQNINNKTSKVAPAKNNNNVTKKLPVKELGQLRLSVFRLLNCS